MKKRIFAAVLAVLCAFGTAGCLKNTTELSMQKTIYDAMLMDPETGTNVIIMYENMSASIGGSFYTPEEYTEILEKDVKDGKDYKEISKEETEFCGETYYSFIWETTNEGGVKIQQCSLVRKVEDYMLCMAFSYVPEVMGLEDLKGLFEELTITSSEAA